MITICPECRKLGIVATVGGPTCKHQLNSGVLWWPSNWSTMSEYDRVAWLVKKAKEVKP